ncbi:MAG TPA: hypothetical protein PL124_04095 [Candidatus Cloacimonadota bacterium]|nr:hypothetical protein [Candidatus Cloacimonadota bacterium]HPS38573.1 hypothetical protein [Candidatus Cloacimonadota bacterium]
MKRIYLLIIVISVLGSLMATDTLMLPNRRKIEGTIKGASSSQIYIIDNDGVLLAVPKGLVKYAYRGKTDITTDLLLASDYSEPVGIRSAQRTSVDSLAVSPQVVALNRIDSKLTMIATPLWISLVLGVLLTLVSIL